MKITHTSNVYSAILTENEWYGVGKEAQAALRSRIHDDAKKLDCCYISIIVQPDELLSSAPIQTRHQVWRHTFPMTAEEELHEKLMQLVADYVSSDKLTFAQARTVARRVFG